MRETIDCAVWMVPEHVGWMREVMRECASVRERVKFHAVGLDGTPWHPGSPEVAASDALRRSALALKRYDACLVPVTLSTLGWTRMALAGVEESIATPLLGLAREMTAPGMQDLLALGLADFLWAPVCPEELKVRLAQWAAPGRAALRRACQDEVLEDEACPQQEEPFPADGEPFRTAKARIVTEFERRYVSGMLSRHRGNISQAARAACKNRRAFWQLMRKHEIAADAFRAA